MDASVMLLPVIALGVGGGMIAAIGGYIYGLHKLRHVIERNLGSAAKGIGLATFTGLSPLILLGIATAIGGVVELILRAHNEKKSKIKLNAIFSDYDITKLEVHDIKTHNLIRKYPKIFAEILSKMHKLEVLDLSCKDRKEDDKLNHHFETDSIKYIIKKSGIVNGLLPLRRINLYERIYNMEEIFAKVIENNRNLTVLEFGGNPNFIKPSMIQLIKNHHNILRFKNFHGYNGPKEQGSWEQCVDQCQNNIHNAKIIINKMLDRESKWNDPSFKSELMKRKAAVQEIVSNSSEYYRNNENIPIGLDHLNANFEKYYQEAMNPTMRDQAMQYDEKMIYPDKGDESMSNQNKVKKRLADFDTKNDSKRFKSGLGNNIIYKPLFMNIEDNQFTFNIGRR